MNGRQKLNFNLYKKIYLIRQTEKIIVENYDSNAMKTPMHMSMGSEAIFAGVCQALSKKNKVYGTYRSHGLYLAKTGETDKFLAEMYGKKTGVLGGKGGSMHLLSPENGLFGISAIVGSTIPLATGSAYAHVYQNKGKIKPEDIVTVFFGDGATNEGVFWESINIACLMKLPVLFICDDNDLAVHTPTKARNGYKSLDKIVGQFNCQILSSDTTDAEVIFNLTIKAINSILKKAEPVFLHLKYYRYLEHVGVYEDFKAGYRSKKDYNKWSKKDPVLLQRGKLLMLKIAENKILQVEKQINDKIRKSLKKAQTDSFPSKKDLLTHIFHE